MGRSKSKLTVPQGQIELTFQIISVPLHLLGAVDGHINPHLRELALDDLGGRHTGCTIIRFQSQQQIQRLAILLTDSGALIHDPTGLIQKLIRLIGVIVVGGFQFYISIGRITSNNHICRRLITIRSSLGQFFFIDGVSHSLPHPEVRHIGTGGIGSDNLHTGVLIRHLASNTVHGKGLVVFLITQQTGTVDHVNLAGLERLQAGGGVRNVLDDDLVPIGLFTPVVLVADKAGVLAGHILVIDIGTSTSHTGNGLEIIRNNELRRAHGAHIRPAEVLQIGIEGVVIVECDGVVIDDLHFRNIGDALQRVERRIGLLMFQVSLDRLGVKRLSIVEGNSLPQMEGELCLVIIVFPAFGQAGDNFSVVKVHQILIHQLGCAAQGVVHVKGRKICGFRSNGKGQNFFPCVRPRTGGRGAFGFRRDWTAAGR